MTDTKPTPPDATIQALAYALVLLREFRALASVANLTEAVKQIDALLGPDGSALNLPPDQRAPDVVVMTQDDYMRLRRSHHQLLTAARNAFAPKCDCPRCQEFEEAIRYAERLKPALHVEGGGYDDRR